MAQQTAVRFLFEKMKNFNSNSNLSDIENKLIDLFKTAAKMEKQQIIDAFDSGGSPDPGEPWITNGQQYYDKIY